MIRGTTPTITFTFSTIQASEISTAYLTAQIKDCTVFEKTLDEATVDTDANTISWELTQAETLLLRGQVSMQIRYKIGSKAYASRIYTKSAAEILKEGEI